MFFPWLSIVKAFVVFIEVITFLYHVGQQLHLLLTCLEQIGISDNLDLANDTLESITVVSFVLVCLIFDGGDSETSKKCTKLVLERIIDCCTNSA